MPVTASATFDPQADLVDLRGKVIIVTGGTGGIGFATVHQLARAGATVYLAARNESLATAALAELQSEGLTNVHWLKLDLADPRDAKKSAEDFLKKEQRLDILVNNAAQVFAPFEVGKDGVARVPIVNYISPYIFTETLLPLLQKTAEEPDSDVRIVNVGSRAYSMVSGPVKIKEIQDFNVEYKGHILSNLKRYGHSKFCLMLWTSTLQRRLLSSAPTAGNPITVISLHPGVVDSNSHKRPWLKHLSWFLRLFVMSPDEGAYNTLFAAAGKKVRENREEYQGAYLEEKPTGTKVVPTELARDEELARDLEETTRKFLSGIGVL